MASYNTPHFLRERGSLVIEKSKSRLLSRRGIRLREHPL